MRRAAAVLLLSGCATVPALSLELDLIPTPQHVELLGFDATLAEVTLASRDDPKVSLAARILQESLGVPVRLAKASPHSGEQAYTLTTTARGEARIAGEPQGVLYGAMTLLQLVNGRRVPGVFIRDWPDFEFRGAADFLLYTEVHRWSLDRGRGWAAFEALARRKLDQCLRYKINMVPIDGFGWGLAERPPEYAPVMRGLNAYARERGIRLMFGGYGADYEMVYDSNPLYQRPRYLGKVHRTDYSCMGAPGSRQSTMGRCRSNEALNREKAREIREFVQAIEPGMLYLHHEDYAFYLRTEGQWKKRCERCRARWPNDDLGAPDGGAAALAEGYAALIREVECPVVLVSPVYGPENASSEEWDRVLRLWKNVTRLLPRSPNVMVCFRESFGERRWVDAYNAAVPDFGAWIYFAGGGEHYYSDAPFVATPILSAAFKGARGLYYPNGDAYQEPQQLLNAEYAWNARTPGSTPDLATWRALASADLRPPEIFGAFLRRACAKLYGAAAAPFMVEYFTAFEKSPAPRLFEKVYASPCLWRSLTLDPKLPGRWEAAARMFERGEKFLRQALAASPNEDLEFLLRSTEVALSLARYLSGKESAELDRAARLAAEYFPEPVDPVSEVGTVRYMIDRLRAAEPK